MENLKFSTLHIANLSNENIRGLVGRSCDDAALVIIAIGDLPKAILVNLTSNVDLVLETSVEISSTDEFYIAFNQETTNPFLFDTIITFIDEV